MDWTESYVDSYQLYFSKSQLVLFYIVLLKDITKLNRTSINWGMVESFQFNFSFKDFENHRSYVG